MISTRLFGLPEQSLLRRNCGNPDADETISALTVQSPLPTFPPGPCDVQSKVISGGLMLDGYDGNS